MDVESELTTTDILPGSSVVPSGQGMNGNHATAGGVAGAVVFMVVLVAVFIGRRKCRSRAGRHSNVSTDEENKDMPHQPGITDPINTDAYEQAVFFASDPTSKESFKWSDISKDLKWMLKNHLMDHRRIKLQKIIGKGEFGCVYEALLYLDPQTANNYLSVTQQPQTVAVKTLKGGILTTESVESFLKEGIIMKDFCHPNVLKLIGVALQDTSPPMIVMPYMKHGSLKKFIRQPEIVMTVRELVQLGMQVADGMSYLACLKFVHRDLAARNCMLDESLVVKIADFGLSRDIYSRDYYTSGDIHARLPVKWMAPESLTQAKYSTKSDVWSFGILLWELMTRGATPYPDVSNWDVREYIVNGRRMCQPEVCPDEVYAIMTRCWLESADERPTFIEINTELKSILSCDSEADNADDDHDYINLCIAVDASDETDGGLNEASKISISEIQTTSTRPTK